MAFLQRGFQSASADRYRIQVYQTLGILLKLVVITVTIGKNELSKYVSVHVCIHCFHVYIHVCVYLTDGLQHSLWFQEKENAGWLDQQAQRTWILYEDCSRAENMIHM